MYKQSVSANVVIRLHDGAQIPLTNGNRDYEEYKVWLSQGNTVAAYEPPPLSGADVDRERDRRLMTFTFATVIYDFDEVSRNRIDKARGSALAAIIAGAEANDLRWADANNDFGWIAADNSFVTMDAPTCLAFGNAAAAWEGLHIVAARALKNMSPIPSDYATNDSYWP